MATVLLACFTLLSGNRIGASGEPPGPSLTIDYDQLPTVAIDAKDAPLVQILSQLADRLHLQIDNSLSVGNSPIISGSFKGDIADILRRVLLRDMNYLILYHGSVIERVVISPSGGARTVADVPPSPNEENGIRAPDTWLGNAAPAKEVAVAAPLPFDAAKAEPARSPLARLLDAQASLIQQTVTDTGSAAGPNASASAPQPRSSSTGAAQMSLAAMTRAAQTNVRMLVKALNSACIGASCGP
jgi:hypothetical protein